MKTNHVFFLIIVSGLIIACNGNTNTISEAEEVNKNQVQIKNDTISGVYNNYILLKDALVKSDAKLAGTVGADLADELNNIQGCEVAAAAAREINSSSDIKLQRAKFLVLSAEIIPVIRSAEITSGSIFVIHCPMADEGRGGDWLSSIKEVRNPYYGDEMLECGEVTEELKMN